MYRFSMLSGFVLFIGVAAIWPTRTAAHSSERGDTTPIILFPPTHDLVGYDLATVTGVDPSTTQIFRITSDEAVGREGVDATIDSATTFQVRAERDGYGDGRVYRVDYFGAGNACSLHVMVPQSPKRLAIDSGTQYCIGAGC